MVLSSMAGRVRSEVGCRREAEAAVTTLYLLIGREGTRVSRSG